MQDDALELLEASLEASESARNTGVTSEQLREAEQLLTLRLAGKRRRRVPARATVGPGPPATRGPPLVLESLSAALTKALQRGQRISADPGVVAQQLIAASSAELLDMLPTLVPDPQMSTRVGAAPTVCPEVDTLDVQRDYPNLVPNQFVGGRLRQYASAWVQRFPISRYRAAKLVHPMLSSGWSPRLLDFKTAVSHRIDLPNFVPPDQERQVDEAIDTMLATGCIEEVGGDARNHAGTVLYTLPLLLVPKKNSDKLRVCYDARALNEQIENFHFKLETADVAASLMREGDFLFSIDCAQGYYQIPLNEKFRRFCCFQWRGRVFRWCVLPFGVSPAPRVYTQMMKLLLTRWREKGWRCSGYIDDLIFMASSWEEALQIRAAVLQDLSDLGLQINAKKSSLTPSHSVEYLGYIFQSSPHCVRVCPPTR